MISRRKYSSFEQRLAAFARGDPVSPPGGDEQFGLLILRRQFWRLFIALALFTLFLIVIFLVAGRIRYEIVIGRIDGEIWEPSTYLPVEVSVREYLESRGRADMVPQRLVWHYLKEEEASRGGITLKIRGPNSLGRKEGDVVLALAPSLFKASSYWFGASGERRAKIQVCALFLAILHEWAHHSSGSHEEGIAEEDRVLASPPRKIGEVDGLTPEDFREARRVIDHYIRYR